MSVCGTNLMEVSLHNPCTLVGYMALEGKASSEVRSVYLRSSVFLVAGQ